ncbi:hypothetical protein N658DRAFT_495622 [Parathielavia hyrcaniae]|uniref:Uncharacterized protein n=1 Tax=Parathielavia hyrcaniae TaxID=113614 RepID=A0AAN6Q290_9PEZI|nr:hypothetical protein N658DRAFT_495622 [Parathielavia hyrcaniae]
MSHVLKQRSTRFRPVARHRSKASLEGKLPLPRAGLIYPFGQTLLRHHRGDYGVYSAVKANLGVPHLTPGMLDTVFSRLFDEATEMLQEDETKHLPRDPLQFIALPRKRPAVRETWMRRNKDFLLSVFLALRAARW